MNYSAFDYACMARAIRLARRGMATTQPNPRVGCVLALNGEVVGEGWHESAGSPHAEVNALASTKHKVNGATAYVTLEPCSHEGRTGPCTEALLDAGIAEVFIATRDPNPHVDGRGIARLRDAGVTCHTGLMESAARALNPGFFKRMLKQLPWVRVKLAQGLDGRLALASGESQWITGAAARKDVQSWRARSSAVLTGIGTVLADDPSLNVRSGNAGPQPLRVIADSQWRTPVTSRTLGLDGTVVIAGREDIGVPAELKRTRAECLPVPADKAGISLRGLLRQLAHREVNEVHVEAGGQLTGSLLKAGLIDELLIYQAPCLLGETGLPNFVLGGVDVMAQRPRFVCLDQRMVGDDLRMRLRPQYCEDTCLPES